MSEPATAAPNRSAALPALTGARFFAAFAVVVYHYGLGAAAQVSPLLAKLASAGPTAVSFFYVLSGTVMTWGCTRDDGTPARPEQIFWSQRAARILPAYWLALGLSVVPCAFAVMPLHPGAGGVLRILLALGAALLLEQAFIPPLSEGLNTPGWSISCEAFFYLLWPSLVTRLRRERSGAPWRSVALCYAVGITAPICGVALVGAHLLDGGAHATLTADVPTTELLGRLLSYFPPLRLPEFAIGILLGHALRRTPPAPASFARETAQELFSVALVVLAAFLLGSGVVGRLTRLAFANRVAIESGTLAPVFAFLVWTLARSRGAVHRALSTKALLQLGEASYALYILQEPVLVWTTAILKRAAPSLMLHWDSVLFWLYALLLIAISLAVHQLWEMPLRSKLLSRLSLHQGLSTARQR